MFERKTKAGKFLGNESGAAGCNGGCKSNVADPYNNADARER